MVPSERTHLRNRPCGHWLLCLWLLFRPRLLFRLRLLRSEFRRWLSSGTADLLRGGRWLWIVCLLCQASFGLFLCQEAKQQVRVVFFYADFCLRTQTDRWRLKRGQARRPSKKGAMRAPGSHSRAPLGWHG